MPYDYNGNYYDVDIGGYDPYGMSDQSQRGQTQMINSDIQPYFQDWFRKSQDVWSRRPFTNDAFINPWESMPTTTASPYFQQWLQSGMPGAVGQLTERSKSAKGRKDIREAEAKAGTGNVPPKTQMGGGNQFPTTSPPSGYQWVWDSSSMQYVLDPTKPTGRTQFDPEYLSWLEGRDTTEYNRELQRIQAQMTMSQYQQASIDFQNKQLEQQMAMENSQMEAQKAEQERQYKAQLAANPMSWLQYSAYTGEAPAVQPWMLPLSAGDYGWQVGQAIPGWTKEGGTGMGDLRTPSAQLWQRMGPTAQAQFKGYQQWDTGARPEEIDFRMGATTAPGGRNNLRWMR